MRLFVAAVFFGALGCCLGPTTETPAPPPPSTSSPLSQALHDLGEAGAGAATNTQPVTTSSTPTPPTTPLPAGSEPLTGPPSPLAPDSPACTEARAAKKAVNDDLVQLRLTIGAETGQRVEQAAAAMKACTEDMACMRDPKARIAKMEAYDRAKAAHDGETQRLATAELGLFEADKAVRAACGQ